MFGALVPSLADDLDVYIPWAVVCVLLGILVAFQAFCMHSIEHNHERLMMGLSSDGALLHARLANDSWNERVRQFKRHKAQEAIRRQGSDARDHL